MNKPKQLQPTSDLTVAIADYYEYTMAEANQQEGITGKQTVFDTIVRRLPTNKVVGTFERNGVKYDELEKRDYLINAGLEQVAATMLAGTGSAKIKKYLQTTQGVTDQQFLDWAEHISFKGDLYAMKEGTIFFAQEHQMRVHEKFEEAQVYESLILNTINPQTAVATTANDIAEAAPGKVLLEGGSRRAGSPQSAIYNSRAARIGGFTASSNVAYGMLANEKVGGTHGHSYVMLHDTEEDAFAAQIETFGDKVTFLLDTYNVDEALETAMQLVKEQGLQHFAFRIDSGDLEEQAKAIHQRMQRQGYERTDYTIVASDDLTAGKIAKLEANGADIDKYLVGTYVVNPPKPVTAVYKLAAYEDKEGWVNKGKLSADFGKATLPGIKQVYRVQGEDGYFKKDIIAFEGEDIQTHLEQGDTYEPLLIPIIEQGAQVYDFPSVQAISKYRKEQLSNFRDISQYDVVISERIRAEQQALLQEHGFVKEATYMTIDKLV